MVCQPWKPIKLTVSPAKVDGNILALDESGLLQPLSQRGDRLRKAGFRRAPEKPDHRDGRLLRARRERQRRRAAEQRDERAALHSITSSARASSVSGTSSPSAFAVLRLMTSPYLVGACTGRSAGFSPLRMRSTYPAACRNWSTRSGP